MTKRTPNEAVYEFTLNQPLNMISENLSELNATLTKIDVQDTITFVNMDTKHHYDRRHQLMFLRLSDYTLLRLYKGYSISAAQNHKLSQQFVGPFYVIKQVERLAYKLNIPDHWWIYPVFTIT